MDISELKFPLCLDDGKTWHPAFFKHTAAHTIPLETSGNNLMFLTLQADPGSSCEGLSAERAKGGRYVQFRVKDFSGKNVCFLLS